MHSACTTKRHRKPGSATVYTVVPLDETVHERRPSRQNAVLPTRKTRSSNRALREHLRRTTATQSHVLTDALFTVSAILCSPAELGNRCLRFLQRLDWRSAMSSGRTSSSWTWTPFSSRAARRSGSHIASTGRPVSLPPVTDVSADR